MEFKELGRFVSTASVAELINNDQKFLHFIQVSLGRYMRNDWGDLSTEDCKMNDNAIKSGEERILASYPFPAGASWNGESKLWIITEWDHSVTTLLFPSEY